MIVWIQGDVKKVLAHFENPGIGWEEIYRTEQEFQS
tara:strand:- start:131 stop:238 length:108 start_codon:yes stop_codon:yes gene_type:complete